MLLLAGGTPPAVGTPPKGPTYGSPSGAAHAFPPDPTPGGPQRPYEPDVPGPRNIDALSATVTADGATERGVRVAFDRTSRADTGGAPAGARRFVFLFDDSIRFRPESFPVCARSVIEENGVAACPAGSRAGRGTSHLNPEGTAEVLAFNTRYGNGARGALVTIPATGTILELTWERVTPVYRQSGYLWALDEILPPTQVPPQERAGTRRFELEWGATRHTADGTVSFAESSAGAGERLRIGLWSWFVTGQVALPWTTAVRQDP
ncbi:hypothetical protein [Streptomyces sp. NBC_00872]|uniref:hypothetical protein n=1 Tax=Streptomyces sp. NBC_00872 TaxID=2903686 RepID=UPI0038687D25|nr:hypothetical protein OG214_23400 [Streptomyces sp. NBC_00872]